MNLIIIKEYSVYMDDEYPHNFRKLYKGITVRCTKMIMIVHNIADSL